jgi:hypothetical protein
VKPLALERHALGPRVRDVGLLAALGGLNVARSLEVEVAV